MPTLAGTPPPGGGGRPEGSIPTLAPIQAVLFELRNKTDGSLIVVSKIKRSELAVFEYWRFQHMLTVWHISTKSFP